MEKHQFKIIYSNEDDVYRILDLTDTSIVGITEMYETEDDRKLQIILHNEIKTKKVVSAKVKGYGIFINLDEDNMPIKSKSEEDYLRSVLRQMAEFFRISEIGKNPDFFKEYYIPQGNRNTTLSDTTKVPEKSPNVENLQAPVVVSLPKKKEKKKVDGAAVILYIAIAIVWLLIVGAIVGVIWFFCHVGGILGAVLFVLCAIAFIPEALKR